MPGHELLFATLLLASRILTIESFIGMPTTISPSSHVRLQMAGRGMGMGGASAKKKKKNGSSKKGGMGIASKKKTVASFDVNASLLRHEKRYEDIMKASAKSMAGEEEDPRWATNPAEGDDIMTTEYVIAARADTKVRDWVPIAQLCVKRPENEYGNTKEILQEAISTYCRELSGMASMSAPVFSTVARNVVQYGVEPVDSFYKHVYDNVVERSADNADLMTKSQAKSILGLAETEGQMDKSEIKQAYRKLSFALHPDRFVGTEKETEEAAERYANVQRAFETLSSGVREEGTSWYESLGGKSRTDFQGPVNLLPLGAAQAQMERRSVEAAILGLDPELVQSFVARNFGSK